MFVYHFRPQKLIGETLMPLNMLKDLNPQAYDIQAAKYKGREKLLTRKIPLLNCLWNDVLHFSPINPQLILDCFRENGLDDSEREPLKVFKIPIEKLDEENTICFQSFNLDYGSFDPELEKYWHFKKSEYRELQSVEDQQIKIWKQDRENNRKLFWYSHTMHILSKTNLNTAELDELTCL